MTATLARAWRSPAAGSFKQGYQQDMVSDEVPFTLSKMEVVVDDHLLTKFSSTLYDTHTHLEAGETNEEMLAMSQIRYQGSMSGLRSRRTSVGETSSTTKRSMSAPLHSTDLMADEKSTRERGWQPQSGT